MVVLERQFVNIFDEDEIRDVRMLYDISVDRSVGGVSATDVETIFLVLNHEILKQSVADEMGCKQKKQYNQCNDNKIVHIVLMSNEKQWNFRISTNLFIIVLKMVQKC